MFHSSSENNIAGGSFNAPQARASVVVNVSERGPVTVTRHDETTPRATEFSNIRQEVTHWDCLPGHIVYAEHLSKKGRGPALWIPEPDMNLPPEYREEGVSIGDVGIVEPSGSFDFFFNINKPKEHAVNCDRPNDFQPLDPLLRSREISNIEIFGAGSFLASSSIKRVQSRSGSTNGVLEFESSASEGAILAMPDATFQSNLKNLDRFYQHIGIHAESWYQYANGPDMGRRLNNGDLCLVIGCDKTTSWGIATFSNSLTTSQLQFRRVGSSGDPEPSYTWEHSGTADSPRVGPSRRGAIPNQCLFVRYLSFKLSERAWPGLRDPTGVQIRMESHESTNPGSRQSNPSNLSAPRTFSSILSHVLRLIPGFNTDCRETKALPETTQGSLETVAVSYAISKTPPLSMHLIDYLLQFPGAKVAATPGVEWHSKYTPVDKVANYVSKFIENVLSENEVRLNESGVTYFHPLPSSSATSANIAANSLTPLGLALVALKSAHDMVPKAGTYKKKCISLVDRCAQLIVNVCSRTEVDSPMLPISGLDLLENTCTAVRNTIMKLSDDAPVEDFFNIEEIEREIETAGIGLVPAFTVFNVNTATQNQVPENLHWALEQDQQEFLLYLDSLLKDAESCIDAMHGPTPTSPVRDSNEQGDLQTPEPDDIVGVHGAPSVDVAVRDGERLSGDVEYNFISTTQMAAKVVPDDHHPMIVRENIPSDISQASNGDDESPEVGELNLALRRENAVVQIYAAHQLARTRTFHYPLSNHDSLLGWGHRLRRWLYCFNIFRVIVICTTLAFGLLKAVLSYANQRFGVLILEIFSLIAFNIILQIISWRVNDVMLDADGLPLEPSYVPNVFRRQPQTDFVGIPTMRGVYITRDHSTIASESDRITPTSTRTYARSLTPGSPPQDSFSLEEVDTNTQHSTFSSDNTILRPRVPYQSSAQDEHGNPMLSHLAFELGAHGATTKPGALEISAEVPILIKGDMPSRMQTPTPITDPSTSVSQATQEPTVTAHHIDSQRVVDQTTASSTAIRMRRPVPEY